MRAIKKRNDMVQEKVDTYQLPKLDAQNTVTSDTQVTIGDLHGNAINLVFFLIKQGVLTGISSEDYNSLVSIYTKETSYASNYRTIETLTAKELQTFESILKKGKYNRPALVRLIGDEMADRGRNDYLTLLILNALKENGVPYEILVSNHSIEFHEACEKGGDFSRSMLTWGGHDLSMTNMSDLVRQGIITKEKILQLWETVYKPNLTALSYTLSEEQNHITIHSHAPIGLNTIQALAEKFEVAYKGETAVQLAETIERINAKFKTHVNKNEVHTLYERAYLKEQYGVNDAERSDANRNHSLEDLMWNRNYVNIKQPIMHKGYQITYISGHNSPTFSELQNLGPQYICLDNKLGKSKGDNVGLYKIFYSTESPLQKAPARTSQNASSFFGSTSQTFINPSAQQNLMTTITYTYKGEQYLLLGRRAECEGVIHAWNFPTEPVTSRELNPIAAKAMLAKQIPYSTASEVTFLTAADITLRDRVRQCHFFSCDLGDLSRDPEKYRALQALQGQGPLENGTLVFASVNELKNQISSEEPTLAGHPIFKPVLSAIERLELLKPPTHKGHEKPTDDESQREKKPECVIS